MGALSLMRVDFSNLDPDSRKLRVLAKWLLLILLAVLGPSWLTGCGGGLESESLLLEGRTMGTGYSVQIAAPPPALDQQALAGEIEALFEEINDLMSTYRDDSELSRFNANGSTDWVAVHPELAEVVGAAQAISAASDGAFDITVGPLVNLWGFGPEVKPDALPSEAEIQQALARVGYQKLEVRQDPPALRKAQPDLYLDLSAIAKGYAVDRLAAVVRGFGIDNALVEIGGELYGWGRNDKGEPWRIAVERPETDRRQVFRVLSLEERGMATSGDYRNYFEVDGVHYSHTINPHTGRPVQHRLASVTVVDDSTMRADAWATALLVLGPEKGMALANSQSLMALLIERQPGDHTLEALATDGAPPSAGARASAE